MPGSGKNSAPRILCNSFSTVNFSVLLMTGRFCWLCPTEFRDTHPTNLRRTVDCALTFSSARFLTLDLLLLDERTLGPKAPRSRRRLIMQIRPGTPASTRRGFLKRGLTAGAITIGANAIHAPFALGKQDDEVKPGGLSKGDAALLRFAAAAEILETDF